MARFDLSKYATVEERLRAFWSEPDNQDARIVTVNHTSNEKDWLMEARLYMSAGDQANDLPKTTGWASETNADQFSLERCETSSIGRMLANYLYSGSKKGEDAPRPSRDEMQKVERVTNRDFVGEADRITDVESLRMLYAQAKAAGAPAKDLEKVKAHGEALGASGKDSGAGASVPSKSAKG